jgi:hypothetical protein
MLLQAIETETEPHQRFLPPWTEGLATRYRMRTLVFLTSRYAPLLRGCPEAVLLPLIRSTLGRPRTPRLHREILP